MRPPEQMPAPRSKEEAQKHTQRKLAAIVFTDIVGYTALTQTDEALALEVLEKHNRLLRPFFPKYGGREVKTIGDSFLIEFESSLDATLCAIEFQKFLHDYNASAREDWKIMLRVGIHLGDVVHEGNDIFGDAVNIASRIQPLADSEGICVSEQVFDQIHNKIPYSLEQLESKELKNVRFQTKIYSIIMPWEEKEMLADSEQPIDESEIQRIAVLPFASMSPDPNDEYFADGLTEELIDRLCQIRELEVISRTSIMIFKKKEKKASEIGKELRAGALVEGSVRKVGNKVRVTAQLIRASTEGHLWSSRYDRDLEDIFAVQSDIAEQVAQALKIKLLPVEKKAIERNATESSKAHTLYLKGRYYWNERTREGVQKAIEYFKEAVRIDSNYARAYSGLSDSYGILENWGYMTSAEARPKARKYAMKALESDSFLAEAHASMASLLMTEWDPEESEQEFKRAIELNPNYATAHHWYGNGLLNIQGRHEESIFQLREAKKLDPLSPMVTTNLGDRLFAAGRLKEAETEYRAVLQSEPDFAYTRSQLGLVLAAQGRFEEAITETRKTTDSRPAPSMVNLVFVYYVAGRKNEAEKLLRELESRHDATPGFCTNIDLAKAYAATDENDKAISFLNNALDEKSNQLITELNDPHFDKLRSDSRFKKILTTMGMDKRIYP